MKRTLSLLLCLLLLVGFVPLREARAATVTLTFDPGEGTGTPVTVTTDSSIDYPIPNPADTTINFTAPSGKEFYMWDLGDGYFVPYGTTTTFGGDTTLTAIWKDVGATVHPVYFDTRGGTPVAYQLIKDGEMVTKPTDPTRAGWTFDGWCIDSALTETFDFNTPITKDITLYARWGSYIFASAYDATNDEGSRGGMVRADSGKYYTNASFWARENGNVTLTAKADNGYKFVKWVKDTKDGETVTINNSFTVTFTGEVTYYAIFEVDPDAVYSVTVSNDGNGTATASPESGKSGTEVTLTATPTKDGYEFDRWEVTPDIVTVTDDNKLTIGTTNVAVKAIFKLATYNVNVTVNGNGTATADHISGCMGTEVALTAIPASNHRFVKWIVVSGGVTITTDNKFTIGTADVQIEAIFEPITYKVTIINDGSGRGTANASPAFGISGTEVTLTATPNSGYKFKEWQVVSGGVTVTGDKFTIGTAEVEIKPVFEPITYTLTFDPNGGMGSYGPITVNYGEEYTLPNPADIGITAPAGKEFYMWDLGGFSAPVGAKPTFNTDTTLKAMWKDAGVTTYTVSFETFFATTGASPVVEQLVPDGQKAKKPSNPTRTGWSFDAWCTDPALTTTFDWDTPITADITLYASWGSFIFASAYDATNDTDSKGGMVRADSGTYYTNASFWATENGNVTLTAKADDGYRFVKWVKDTKDGETVSTNNAFSISFTGQVTYFAIFEVGTSPTYSVTVSNDGNGTATASPTSGVTGTDVTLTATPNSGYQFKEWQVVTGGVTVADNKFTIGMANVEVKAIFEKEATASPTPGPSTTPVPGTSATPAPTPTPVPTPTPEPATVKKVQAKKSLKLTAPKIKKATYLWQYRTGKTGAWLTVRKGTKQKLSVKATMALDGYQYRCQVKAPAGTISYTDIYELYVYEPLKVRKQPKWGKICLPGTKRTISITAQGASSYQWVTRANGSSPWTKIEGATGASYVVDVQEGMNNRQYACEISGKAGTARSKAAVVKIAPWPKVKITRQPQWKKPVTSGSPVTLTVKALNAETYQWYYRTSKNGAWIIMGGETKTTVTFPAPANGNGYQYRCTVKGKGGTVDSKPVTLKVVTP